MWAANGPGRVCVFIQPLADADCSIVVRGCQIHGHSQGQQDPRGEGNCFETGSVLWKFKWPLLTYFWSPVAGLHREGNSATGGTTQAAGQCLENCGRDGACRQVRACHRQDQARHYLRGVSLPVGANVLASCSCDPDGIHSGNATSMGSAVIAPIFHSLALVCYKHMEVRLYWTWGQGLSSYSAGP